MRGVCGEGYPEGLRAINFGWRRVGS